MCPYVAKVDAPGLLATLLLGCLLLLLLVRLEGEVEELKDLLVFDLVLACHLLQVDRRGSRDLGDSRLEDGYAKRGSADGMWIKLVSTRNLPAVT
jgi:hypothetical protein